MLRVAISIAEPAPGEGAQGVRDGMFRSPVLIDEEARSPQPQPIEELRVFPGCVAEFLVETARLYEDGPPHSDVRRRQAVHIAVREERLGVQAKAAVEAFDRACSRAGGRRRRGAGHNVDAGIGIQPRQQPIEPLVWGDAVVVGEGQELGAGAPRADIACVGRPFRAGQGDILDERGVVREGRFIAFVMRAVIDHDEPAFATLCELRDERAQKAAEQVRPRMRGHDHVDALRRLCRARRYRSHAEQSQSSMRSRPRMSNSYCRSRNARSAAAAGCE